MAASIGDAVSGSSDQQGAAVLVLPADSVFEFGGGGDGENSDDDLEARVEVGSPVGSFIWPEVRQEDSVSLGGDDTDLDALIDEVLGNVNGGDSDAGNGDPSAFDNPAPQPQLSTPAGGSAARESAQFNSTTRQFEILHGAPVHFNLGGGAYRTVVLYLRHALDTLAGKSIHACNEHRSKTGGKAAFEVGQGGDYAVSYYADEAGVAFCKIEAEADSITELDLTFLCLSNLPCLEGKTWKDAEQNCRTGRFKNRRNFRWRQEDRPQAAARNRCRRPPRRLPAHAGDGHPPQGPRPQDEGGEGRCGRVRQGQEAPRDKLQEAVKGA